MDYGFIRCSEKIKDRVEPYKGYAAYDNGVDEAEQDYVVDHIRGFSYVFLPEEN